MVNDSIVETMLRRFNSLNDVAVERAYMTMSEFDGIKSFMQDLMRENRKLRDLVAELEYLDSEAKQGAELAEDEINYLRGNMKKLSAENRHLTNALANIRDTDAEAKTLQGVAGRALDSEVSEPSHSSTEIDRDRFERWAELYIGWNDHELKRDNDDQDVYVMDITQYAWAAWQAARAQDVQISALDEYQKFDQELCREVFEKLNAEFDKDPREGMTVYTEDWRASVDHLIRLGRQSAGSEKAGSSQ